VVPSSSVDRGGTFRLAGGEQRQLPRVTHHSSVGGGRPLACTHLRLFSQRLGIASLRLDPGGCGAHGAMVGDADSYCFDCNSGNSNLKGRATHWVRFGMDALREELSDAVIVQGIAVTALWLARARGVSLLEAQQ
jgi:hypothetical protein